MASPFYTISGLPVHALVVHFAVVLLPLAAAAALVALYFPTFKRRYFSAILLGVFLGSGAAFVAKQSGEELAGRIGLPKTHANWGNILPWVALVFLALLVLWNRKVILNQSQNANLFTHAIAVVGVAVIGLTLLVGHTGAQAVWKGRLNPQSSTASTANTNSGSSNASSGLKMSVVAKHNSASDCWSAINGKVYNLTKWINRHPGGPQVIKNLCGTDGSAGFNGQHQGQQRPANELSGFLVGDLAN